MPCTYAINAQIAVTEGDETPSIHAPTAADRPGRAGWSGRHADHRWHGAGLQSQVHSRSTIRNNLRFRQGDPGQVASGHPANWTRARMLSLQGISKSFHRRAGAGGHPSRRPRQAKSTRSSARTAPASRPLIKIIAGVYQPDAGQMDFDGSPFSWAGPADAKNAGIHVIYQEFVLFPHLTVAENIFSAMSGAIGSVSSTIARTRAGRGRRCCASSASISIPQIAGLGAVGRRPADGRDRQGAGRTRSSC